LKQIETDWKFSWLRPHGFSHLPEHPQFCSLTTFNSFWKPGFANYPRCFQRQNA
jgi:hypothetical protein